jgi:hypothetical protein
MAEIALQAAYKGIDARLSNAATVFGDRVRVSIAPASFAYPYAIQFWQAGGEDNSIRAQDAALTIGVKCVSTKFSDAFRGASEISALLNDKGEQRSPNDFVYGGADWRILAITEGVTIYVPEQLSDSEIAYHVGASYEFIMVRR